MPRPPFRSLSWRCEDTNIFSMRILEGECRPLDEYNLSSSLKRWMAVKIKNVLLCECAIVQVIVGPIKEQHF